MLTFSRILVTGGAGFIGSNFVRHLLARERHAQIVNLDLLTYAGSLQNLADLCGEARHTFIQGNITDADLIRSVLDEYQIDAVVHFAAESHVDRSISGPSDFIQTNIVGTFTLLEAVRAAWHGRYERCRFVQISTDEVFGTLGETDPAFCETTPYAPNSPYSASKASADHLVRAYHETYGLPVVTTNCSNNYGPYQYPEKLIPLMIINALTGKNLPIYGDGRQIRDWLFVEDHCEAVRLALTKGQNGQTYCVGGLNEKRNIEIVHLICDLLDESRPKVEGSSYREQITYVADRPGHDRRYAINADKVQRAFGWKPRESFETGLRKTIEWYLANENWVNSVMGENYDEWITVNYVAREETS